MFTFCEECGDYFGIEIGVCVHADNLLDPYGKIELSVKLKENIIVLAYSKIGVYDVLTSFL